SITSQLAVINWNHLLLYPKGRPARDILVTPRVRLPKGWNHASSLIARSVDAGENTAIFETVSIETLDDSPVLCGAHFKPVRIRPERGVPHATAVACDSAAGLEMSPAMKKTLERLIVETGRLFGSRPYRAYTFLLALSDHVAHFGLEHHQSS